MELPLTFYSIFALFSNSTIPLDNLVLHELALGERFTRLLSRALSACCSSCSLRICSSSAAFFLACALFFSQSARNSSLDTSRVLPSGLVTIIGIYFFSFPDFLIILYHRIRVLSMIFI